MKICRYLRGTNASGSYGEVARTANMHQFLVQDIGAKWENDVLGRIQNLYTGFTKMPDFSRHHRMDKPVAVRCAPIYLDVFPEMPTDIKPFFAIGTCGLENRGGEGKWNTNPLSRETNFTQIDMFAMDELLNSEKYTYLDLMFGINGLTDEVIADIRNGDCILEETISIEKVRLSACPKQDKNHVIAAAEAVYGGKNVVIHLEPGVTFRHRAREILLQVYSLLHPNLAIRAGYAMYQYPESILDIVRAWSVRIFVVPGEQPLPTFPETIEVVEMNAPKGESGSRLAESLEFWLELSPVNRMNAMREIFKDMERSYGDKELFIAKSDEFRKINREFYGWINKPERIDSLEALYRKLSENPSWGRIPWLYQDLRRFRPRYMHPDASLEKMVADAYVAYNTEEDRERRQALKQLYLFGRGLAEPKLERLHENYQRYFDETFEARTRQAYQALTMKVNALDEENRRLNNDNRSLSVSVEEQKRELWARNEKIGQLNQRQLQQEAELEKKGKLLDEVANALAADTNSEKTDALVTYGQQVTRILDTSRELRSRLHSVQKENDDLKKDSEELQQLDAVLAKEKRSADPYSRKQVVEQVLSDRDVAAQRLAAVKNALGVRCFPDEIAGKVSSLVKEQSDVRQELNNAGMTGEILGNVKGLVGEQTEIRKALGEEGKNGKIADRVQELMNDRAEIHELMVNDGSDPNQTMGEYVTGLATELDVTQSRLKEAEKKIDDIYGLLQINADAEKNTDEQLQDIQDAVESMQELKRNQEKIDNLQQIDELIRKKERQLNELTGDVKRSYWNGIRAHWREFSATLVAGVCLGLLLMVGPIGMNRGPAPETTVPPETTAPIVTTAPTETTVPQDTTAPTETQNVSAEPEMWFTEDVINALQETYGEKMLTGEALDQLFQESELKPLALIGLDTVKQNDLPRRYVLILNEEPQNYDDIYACFSDGEIVVTVNRSNATDTPTSLAVDVFSALRDITGNTEDVELTCRLIKENLPTKCGPAMEQANNEWCGDIQKWMTGKSTDNFKREESLKYQPLLVIEGRDWFVFAVDWEDMNADKAELEKLKSKYELILSSDDAYMFKNKPKATNSSNG